MSGDRSQPDHAVSCRPGCTGPVNLDLDADGYPVGVEVLW